MDPGRTAVAAGQEPTAPAGPGRRAVLAGTAGAGALALAGCGGGDEPAGSAQPAPSQAAGSKQPPAGALAALSDIPDGGGLSVEVDGAPVLLTRDGTTVTGLSAKCTHQGCVVAARGDALTCPCHGSTYDLTGAVTNGPATRPLPKVPVRVQGDNVVPA